MKPIGFSKKLPIDAIRGLKLPADEQAFGKWLLTWPSKADDAQMVKFGYVGRNGRLTRKGERTAAKLGRQARFEP